MILKFGKFKGYRVYDLMASERDDHVSYICWLIRHNIPNRPLRCYMERAAQKLKFEDLNDWYKYHRDFINKQISSYTTSASYEDSFYGHAFDYPEYF